MFFKNAGKWAFLARTMLGVFLAAIAILLWYGISDAKNGTQTDMEWLWWTLLLVILPLCVISVNLADRKSVSPKKSPVSMAMYLQQYPIQPSNLDIDDRVSALELLELEFGRSWDALAALTIIAYMQEQGDWVLVSTREITTFYNATAGHDIVFEFGDLVYQGYVVARMGGFRVTPLFIATAARALCRGRHRTIDGAACVCTA